MNKEQEEKQLQKCITEAKELEKDIKKILEKYHPTTIMVCFSQVIIWLNIANKLSLNTFLLKMSEMYKLIEKTGKENGKI